MVPECTGLVQCIKLIQKAFVWFYGTLSNTRNTISPAGLSLVYTMPVLPRNQNQSVQNILVALTTLVEVSIVVSSSEFTTLILKSSPFRIGV